MASPSTDACTRLIGALQGAGLRALPPRATLTLAWTDGHPVPRATWEHSGGSAHQCLALHGATHTAGLLDAWTEWARHTPLLWAYSASGLPKSRPIEASLALDFRAGALHATSVFLPTFQPGTPALSDTAIFTIHNSPDHSHTHRLMLLLSRVQGRLGLWESCHNTMRRMGLVAGEDLHSAAVIDRLLRGPVGLVKSRHYTPTLDARVALARVYPPTDFTPHPPLW